MKYEYDGLKVGKKEESVYKAEKIAAYNAKQPGKGDRWLEKWVNSRTMTYEPMFEELIKYFLKQIQMLKLQKILLEQNILLL